MQTPEFTPEQKRVAIFVGCLTIIFGGLIFIAHKMAPTQHVARVAIIEPPIPMVPEPEEEKDFDALAKRCAPNVHARTLRALVMTESTLNPWAIGIVGARLDRQPKSLSEALATVTDLDARGYNFSLGLTQVNKSNLARFGQNYESVLDACTNLRVGAAILTECYDRAMPEFRNEQRALQAALSCYYSGNFRRGFVLEEKNSSYVGRVVTAAGKGGPVRIIPAIDPKVAVKSTSSPSTARRARTSAPRQMSDNDPDWAFFADDGAPEDPQAAQWGEMINQQFREN